DHYGPSRSRIAAAVALAHLAHLLENLAGVWARRETRVHIGPGGGDLHPRHREALRQRRGHRLRRSLLDLGEAACGESESPVNWLGWLDRALDLRRGRPERSGQGPRQCAPVVVEDVFAHAEEPS